MTHNSLTTDKPVALEFPIKLEFRKINVDFCEENWKTQRKTLRVRTRTNSKLNPLMTPGPGFEPEPHWWEAGALATVPQLLSQKDVKMICN